MFNKLNFNRLVVILPFVIVVFGSCGSSNEPMLKETFGTYNPDESKPWNSNNNDHINYVKFNSDSTFEISYHTGYYCDEIVKGKFEMSEPPELEKLEPLSYTGHYADHWVYKHHEKEVVRYYLKLKFEQANELGRWNFNCTAQDMFKTVHEYTIYPEALVVLSKEEGGKAYFAIINKNKGYLVAEKIAKFDGNK